jgi:hypothetical protein
MADNERIVKDFQTTPAAEQQKVKTQAQALIDKYNQGARLMAAALQGLFPLLSPYGEPCGVGGIISSGAGWKDNALDCIPVLIMAGERFPISTQNPGVFFTSGKNTVLHHPANFAAGENPRSNLRQEAGQLISDMAQQRCEEYRIPYMDAVKQILTEKPNLRRSYESI